MARPKMVRPEPALIRVVDRVSQTNLDRTGRNRRLENRDK